MNEGPGRLAIRVWRSKWAGGQERKGGVGGQGGRVGGKELKQAGVGTQVPKRQVSNREWASDGEGRREKVSWQAGGPRGEQVCCWEGMGNRGWASYQVRRQAGRQADGVNNQAGASIFS